MMGSKGYHTVNMPEQNVLETLLTRSEF